MIAQNKQELRRYFRHLRNASFSQDEQSGRRALQNLVALPAWKSAHAPMVYISKGTELSTQELLAHFFAQHHAILVPCCLPHQEMCAVPISSYEELQEGAYGILEPKNPLISTKYTPDVVVVPGLAFDHRGTRLGQGGGYFDRFLSLLPQSVVKIGYGYSFQVVDVQLPHDAHDVAMDIVITDSEVVYCDASRA